MAAHKARRIKLNTKMGGVCRTLVQLGECVLGVGLGTGFSEEFGVPALALLDNIQ